MTTIDPPIDGANDPAARYARSIALHAAAREVTPGGVNSNVRLRSQPVPLFFERASGSRMWDVDGNEYIDYSLGMGAIILGHADPVTSDAIAASLALGQLYAGQHTDETALSTFISRTIPWAEMVRLAMSGTEADQAAVRLARTATGRRRIIKFEGHYHGWGDGLFVSSRPSLSEVGPDDAPVPVRMSEGQSRAAADEVLVLPFNDFDALTRCLSATSDVAGVILEPILCNTGLIAPDSGYLVAMRRLVDEAGAVLIFDEVITGFRVGLLGAAAIVGVRPDLVVYAKAMGNGAPIACFAGRRDLMRLVGEERSQHLGTYNGNRISVSAGLATIGALAARADELYPRLSRLGERLAMGLRQAGKEAGLDVAVVHESGVLHSGFGSAQAPRDYRSYVRSERFAMLDQFVRAMQDRGIRLTNRGTWFLSAAHSEADIDGAVEAAAAAYASLTD